MANIKELDRNKVIEKLKNYFPIEKVNEIESDTKLFEKLIGKEWSDVLTFESKKGSTYDAKIRFKSYKDGNIGIDFRFKAKELVIHNRISYTGGNITLTDEDIKNLKEGKNNKVFDVVEENGNISKVFLEVDQDLNALYFYKQEWLRVPTQIYGQKLNNDQINGLKEGAKVDFNLELKGGEIKELTMYFSPKDGKIRFIDKIKENPIKNKVLQDMQVSGIKPQPNLKNKIK